MNEVREGVMWLSGEEHSRQRNSKCKGPEVEAFLECRRNSKEPLWLERCKEGE